MNSHLLKIFVFLGYISRTITDKQVGGYNVKFEANFMAKKRCQIVFSLDVGGDPKLTPPILILDIFLLL